MTDILSAGFNRDILGSQIVVSNASGGALSALKVIRYITPKQVVVASPDTYDQAAATGITITSAPQNGDVQIKTRGPYSDDSWSWTQGLPIFLGSNGILTQTAPTVGCRTIIGYAVAPTTIDIKISEPINL